MHLWYDPIMNTPKTLTLPIHDGAKFTWTRKTGHDAVGCPAAMGMVDESDLSGTRRGVSGRVWADACDEGFYIRSHRTGALVLFTYHHDVMSPDGLEAMARVYESVATDGGSTASPVWAMLIND